MIVPGCLYMKYGSIGSSRLQLCVSRSKPNESECLSDQSCLELYYK